MAHIHALRQKHHDIKKRMMAILNAARIQGRDLTAEEDQEYGPLRVQLEGLGIQIAEKEEEMAAERRGEPISRAAGNGTGTELRVRARGGIGRGSEELFAGPLDNAGFASLEEFLGAIHVGGMDPRLRASASGGMNEAIPSQGGFLVPTEFSAELLQQSLENEIIRPRAQTYTMKTASRKIAGLDALDSSAGAPFGFATAWLNEATAGTVQKAKVRAIELQANKLALFTMASNELIADGMSFEQLVGGALIKAMSWSLDSAFFSGSGAGRPMGILNQPSAIVVAKETSPAQASATIVLPNVLKMFARLHPACLADSVWIANSQTIPQLLALQNAVWNVAHTDYVGGSAVPIVSQDAGGLRMLTRPILFTEKLPVLGSQGDLVLASLSQYAIGMRRDLSIERSNAPGWATDEASYRCILRCDGQGLWNKPYTPLHGDTLSWCVLLGAR